jgi:hypothetical protein
MAQLRLTASDAEDVDVTRLIVNHTTDGDPLSSVSNAYLYEDVDRDGRYSAVDDRLIATATPAASPGKTVSEAYFNFTGLSETIAPANSATGSSFMTSPPASFPARFSMPRSITAASAPVASSAVSMSMVCRSSATV